MTEVIVDVNTRVPKWKSAYAEDVPFDGGKAVLESAGFKIPSLRDNVELRMQEGAYSPVSRNGNWTKEGIVYVPNKGIFLIFDSSAIVDARDITDCHRMKKECYLTDEQTERALLGSIRIRDSVIPTNRFAGYELTSLVFADAAEKYGRFLGENKVIEMPINLLDLEKRPDERPFLRQVGFSRLAKSSAISGDRDLSYKSDVRGMCPLNGVVAQGYTPEQIKAASKKANLSSDAERRLFEALN